ncbi:MAG TPA: baseplate J/gp47 family protein, partial [Candidatus Binatia bacterium]|nr:baseplate J/gp47 family protein [Candidatus Binatia bacterium]
RPTLPGATVRLDSADGLKSLPDEADRREMYRRISPPSTRVHWLRRYLGILLFFLTLSLVFVGVAYTVPAATIQLYPQVQPLQVSRQIVADPQLETVNVSGASVPARRLVVSEVWQSEVATTGSIEVPDAPARGSVVFVNLLDQPVTIPAGTRVSTSAGERIAFQTIDTVEAPGAEGATVEADVVAVEPGPQGNVGPNLVNRVEGSLSLQLEVRNLQPIKGGAVRAVPAVSPDDQDRLRAQVLQQLQTLASAEMEELLTEDEFLALNSLHVAEIEHETFSHFPGERTERLALEIRARIEGTAVDASQANDLIYERLAAAVHPGYELVPESLHFFSEDVLDVDEQGRVTFEMVGEGLVAASLDTRDVLPDVAGQPTGIAASYLYERLPLRDYPSIRVWPNWFDRLPYLPVRIRTQVVTRA